MATIYYLTIAIFDNDESITNFLRFIEKELKLIKILQIRSLGKPFQNYKLDSNRLFLSEILKENHLDTIQDFTFFSDQCFLDNKNYDCTHYQYKVDFPEYYRFYLKNDEPTENIYNHGIIEKDFILNFFIYFDTDQKKYIYYQYLTSDIYYLINEYTTFKYDNEKYWAEINLDINETTNSPYWNFYEQNIKRIFRPKILIDGMVQNSKEYIDEEYLLNLNYYFLGNTNIKLNHDYKWNIIRE